MMNPGMVLYDMTLIDHIVAMLICVVAPILALTSRQMAAEDIRLEPNEKIRLYHSNALLLFVFTLVVVTVWRLPGRTLAGLGFEWPVLNPVVLLLVLAVVLFYGLDYFFQYGIPKWRAKTMQQRHASLTFVPTDTKELFHFVFLALAAGIGEEIIFRGYLIHYIVFWTGNAWSGILVACFFSSALFAFLHGYQGYKSVIKIFFLAMLFAGIFVLSQSLLLVMLIHTLIDVLSGWLGIYILKNFQQEDEAEKEAEG